MIPTSRWSCCSLEFSAYMSSSLLPAVFPGVAGAILLLLGLTAIALLPLNWLGVALIALAIALFVLEAKFTSYGILGAGGAVAMILGALLLVEGPPEFRIRPWTAIGIALPFAAISVFLTTLVIRAHGYKVDTGVSGLVGRDRHCPDCSRSRRKDTRARRILERNQFDCSHRRKPGSRTVG